MSLRGDKRMFAFRFTASVLVSSVLVLLLAQSSTTNAFTVPAHGSGGPLHGQSMIGGNRHTVASSPRRQETELSLFRRLFRRNKKDSSEGTASEDDNDKNKEAKPKKKQVRSGSQIDEEVDVCIIGGGVSGLTAAAEAAKLLAKTNGKVVLLEASPTLGGRVQSDITDDGFVLDRGFAVFIDQYPVAQSVLDFEQLNLGSFLPGALVKVQGRDQLARVADPLRQPQDIFAAIFAPVGSLYDKLALLPVIFHAKTKTVEELFEEKETDTLTALEDRWGLGETILERFFKPFLEGIYLAKLDEQSSRMFHFVFKMFSDGAATLPEGGIGAVSKQLAEKAKNAGVDIRTRQAVDMIEQDGDTFVIKCQGTENKRIVAKSVICATDGQVAQKLLSQVSGFESLSGLAEQPQRSVGCLYYSFESEEPVKEPILILNGIGPERGTEEYPVNNVCFPSAVAKGYAPKGKGLCSVTVLKDAMELYEGRDEQLDQTVRKQLATWFPDYKEDILDKWELKRIYSIMNAQPSQLGGPFPANINGGRDCGAYRGKALPKGLFVCGDHMATATLNGALESGLNAGKAAGKLVK